MVAERLTAPGIGKDLGANFNLNNAFFKGIFMAPNAEKNALKTAIFTAYMLAVSYTHLDVYKRQVFTNIRTSYMTSH